MYLRQVGLMLVYGLSITLSLKLGQSRVAEDEEDGMSVPRIMESRVTCEEARIKCVFRSGCSQALHNYLSGCTDVLKYSDTSNCPPICQNALIALTSTDEGKDLMNCTCKDEACLESKRRVEVCRPSVLRASKNETTVSCEVAQWICQVDESCNTAFEYYHTNCKAMFRGKKCTKRCQNSIDILMRQEKASKLQTCICEDHDVAACTKVQRNMDKLCFNKTRVYQWEIQTNEIDSFEHLSVGSRSVLSLSLFLVVFLSAISRYITML